MPATANTPAAACDPTPTPRMTSWGKINAGQKFNVITQDLDRAFNFADLGKRQMGFLQQVREAYWSETIRLEKKRDGIWPTAHGCNIDCKKLERTTGIARQQWSDAKNELIRSKILILDKNKSLRINKQVEEWVHHETGKPRLTPKLLEFCRQVQPDAPSPVQANFPFTQERVNPRAPHQSTFVSVPPTDALARRNPCTPRMPILADPTAIPCTPRVGILSPPASESLRPATAPIEERPRGVLEKTDPGRVGVEKTPPTPGSDSLPGKTQPWSSPNSQSDYRLLADAKPTPPSTSPPAPRPGRPPIITTEGVDRVLAKWGHLLNKSGRRA